MIHIIDKTHWTPSDRRVLSEKAKAAGLTEDEFIERAAKHTLYTLPSQPVRRVLRKRQTA